MAAHGAPEGGLAQSEPVTYESQFPGDDCTVAYAKDAGVFIADIDWEVAQSRKRYGRAEVMARDPAVILCFGQSNAANHGMGSYRPRHPVFCFNPMDCGFYLAEDPIPGATGSDGSPWGRLGDMLVQDGIVRSVVFISVAFGGTYCSDWAPGGGPARRLALAIERARLSGLEIDQMLWCQGEAEANNTQMRRRQYKRHFLAVEAEIRRLGVGASIFVALATLCATEGRPFENRGEIRAGQLELPDPDLGVFAGPDIDEIGLEGRHDGCHFNEIGLQRAAELWLKAIAAPRNRAWKPGADLVNWKARLRRMKRMV